MMYMRLSCLVVINAASLLAGCGERSAPAVEDSGVATDHSVTVDSYKKDSYNPGPDWWMPDVPQTDLSKPADLPQKLDAAKLDAATPLSFCKGAPHAEADKSPLKVDKIVTSMNYVASCCPPGEVIAFKTINAKGQPLEVSLQVARFPGTKLPPSIKLDLAKPPTGWYFAIYSNPSTFYGHAHTSSHSFKGYLEFSSLLGSPAVQVTACVEATPLDTTNPNKHHFKLWASKVLVNKVCVPQMDQTCNYDPMISSLRGKCNADSTCTCNPGSTKMANGKCK